MFLDGGTRRRLPWSNALKLDASNSFDPNEEISKQILTFFWYCKIDNVVTTGCFENNHTMLMHEGPVWEIPSKQLPVDVEYTFTVHVFNEMKNRYLSKSQQIILADADIPIVMIK